MEPNSSDTVGQVLLRLWLAKDKPAELTAEEIETMDRALPATDWVGDWESDPMSDRATWPEGVAYVVDRVLARYHLATTPGEVRRRCWRNLQAAKLHHDQVAPVSPLAHGDQAEQSPLAQREQTALRILHHYGPELLKVPQIVQYSESGKHGDQIAERTAQESVKALVDAGLAERPLGRGEGVRLTKVGKQRAKALPPVQN